jgi:hypothetical protein
MTKGKDMNRSNEFLSQALGVGMLSVFSIALLSTTSCDDGLDSVCPGLACADEGVAEGNASITGFASIDAFFNSVVNFKGVATGVTADINAELAGIQADFGVSPADVMAAGGKLDAAIKAKLDTTYKMKLVVKAQAPKCEIDAKFSAEVRASCQAKAGCEVDPGKASVQCMGTCSVDASVEGKCEAEADVVCKVSAPSFMCMGTCEGSCTTKLMAAASCSGTCNGTCSGTCEGNTASGNMCNGTCMGMCTGECTATLEASAMCNGSCNGTCSYKPGMASCDARAKVECQLKAEAKAECRGRCEGEFEPPMVDCDASASCEASAKADAKFQAKCTPPSIDIRWVSTGSVSAEVKAQFDYAMGNLKVRLPRLRAAIAKADIVVAAGKELGGDGAQAIEGTLDAFGEGKVDFVAAYRIGKCAPKELDASAKVITDASGSLNGALSTAKSVTAAVGM